MKIAVVSPSFKDFIAFVNKDCNRFNIPENAQISVKNGNIIFKEENIAYIWFYTIFTNQPNVKLLINFDEIILLTDKIDREMEECYNFLKERNQNAKHICTKFKI
jgi:hypothetical protein